MNTFTKIENNSVVGAVVSYRDTLRVVVGVTKLNYITLLNPLGGNRKVSVLRANTQITASKLVAVQETNEGTYLVSKRGTIISAASGRVMGWDAKHVKRIAIIAAANLNA